MADGSSKTSPKAQVRSSRVLDEYWLPPVGTESWIQMKIREFYATPEGRAEKRRLAEDGLLAEEGYPPRMRAKKRAEALECIRREKARKKGQRQAHVKRLHSHRLRQAMPPWADREAMRAIYTEAQRLTDETGQPHEVDHEVPLLGRYVSGLHVEYNLRVIPRRDNRQKSNKH
jgi:hypothetical protein